MAAWVLGMVLTALVCFIFGAVLGARFMRDTIVTRVAAFDRITSNPQQNMLSKVLELIRS